MSRRLGDAGKECPPLSVVRGADADAGPVTQFVHLIEEIDDAQAPLQLGRGEVVLPAAGGKTAAVLSLAVRSVCTNRPQRKVWRSLTARRAAPRCRRRAWRAAPTLRFE